MRKIGSHHGLTAFFLAGLIIVTFFFRQKIPFWHSLLLRYFIWLGVLFALQVSSERKAGGRITAFINDFSPIFFVILIYQSLGDLIQYLRPDIDPVLIRIDQFLFGIDPTLWMQQWIVPWFTDIMSFCYISYYFLPVILIATLYLKNRRKEFSTAVFVLAFGYYLSFIGYILFPAIGPRYTLTNLYTVPLQGVTFLTDFVRDVLNGLEGNKRDCMPSGHTQIVLMVLFLARRYEKVLFYIFFPIVCGLILSTIYLRYHYVIDLFVGAAFAIGSAIVAPRLYEWWNRPKG